MLMTQIRNGVDSQEITLEMKLKQDRQLQSKELIFEPKKLVALAQMYHSLVCHLT